MFIVMGIPSVDIVSGKLAIGSGVICLIGAGVFYSKRTKPNPAVAVHTTPEQFIEH
jgi:hypothetical protein